VFASGSSTACAFGQQMRDDSQAMITVTEHLYWGKKYLDEHQIVDANLSAKIILSYVTKFPAIDFVKNPETEISSKNSEQFKNLIKKRGDDFPIAYITGEKEFYSQSFYVNENVLIPRPETETLIDWFGEKIGNKNIGVCDVGTGSGVIAVILKKWFPKLHMTAVDISPDALEVAKKNAKQLQVDIEFIQSNLLEKITASFEVIVANLPYISSRDMEMLSKTVQFEPKLALESGHDGLDHYRRLLPQAFRSLRPKGAIFLEFGRGQKDALISLLQKHFFSSIEVRPDLAGMDRIIYAQRT
jgi:release factor glutamine methyltransferase